MNRFFVFLLYWILTGLGAEALAAPQNVRFTLRPDMLDLTHCVAEPGAVPLTLTPTHVNLEVLDWKAAPMSTVHTGEFVLRLRSAMPVGSLITYGAGDVFYAVSNVWQPLVTEEESGRLLRVQAIPASQRIEALKIMVPAGLADHVEGEPKIYRATLPFAALIPVRLASIGHKATVTVSSWSPPAAEDSGTPWLNHPETLVDGFVDPVRNFSTMDREAAISPDAPEWILMSWPEPQSIRGFAFWRGAEEGGMGDLKVEFFTGQGNPFESGSSDDWRVLPVMPTLPGEFRSYQFFVGRMAATSTGLRFSSTGGVHRISLGELSVMSPVNADPPEATR